MFPVILRRIKCNKSRERREKNRHRRMNQQILARKVTDRQTERGANWSSEGTSQINFPSTEMDPRNKLHCVPRVLPWFGGMYGWLLQTRFMRCSSEPRDARNLPAESSEMKSLRHFSFTFHECILPVPTQLVNVSMWHRYNCCPVVPEKLIVTQLVKVSAFYGTRSFVNVLIRIRHWFISWARWNNFTPSQLP
jgi:hypothetical protein